MKTQDQLKYEAVYQSVVEQMEQEWLQAGMSQEDLERSKRVADTLDTLVACGVALDDPSPCNNLPAPPVSPLVDTKVLERSRMRKPHRRAHKGGGVPKSGERIISSDF